MRREEIAQGSEHRAQGKPGAKRYERIYAVKLRVNYVILRSKKNKEEI